MLHKCNFQKAENPTRAAKCDVAYSLVKFFHALTLFVLILAVLQLLNLLTKKKTVNSEVKL
jgi:hypothetical protein